ncbi:MAG: Flp pilus assembly complex ATPase component TadA [Alphaproteobacteria bacterium]|nr:Flp pilus assembly complex ATPase component TadA [Alphaproteobacteria bacterium]
MADLQSPNTQATSPMSEVSDKPSVKGSVAPARGGSVAPRFKGSVAPQRKGNSTQKNNSTPVETAPADESPAKDVPPVEEKQPEIAKDDIVAAHKDETPSVPTEPEKVPVESVPSTVTEEVGPRRKETSLPMDKIPAELLRKPKEAEKEPQAEDVAKDAPAAEGKDKQTPQGIMPPARDTTGRTTRLVTTSEISVSSLFADGNECVTAPGGAVPLREDLRLLLALFSNGRFLVADQYQNDGRVMSFKAYAKKHRLQIGEPEIVTMAVISAIYDYAAKKNVVVTRAEAIDDQIVMQQNFVTVVQRAAELRASDIHVIVSTDVTTILYRVDGMLQLAMEYKAEWGEAFVRAAFASADISDANYAQNEYQAAQKSGDTPLRGSQGRLRLPREVLAIRMQFNPIAFGSRYVVLRLLYADTAGSINDPASNLLALGFTPEENDMFYRLRAIPIGLVFVSGPTGSGKSTTLQRNMINLLRERNNEINLITVEDPPEYPIPGARQMPVTNATVEEVKEREFTKALSAALRSDPDMMMIGEIRTLSAANLAFQGALSGHGVWTTVHANSAPATLSRLKDIGVEDFKLEDPSLVRGLMAQRLFRTLCPHCRVPVSQQPKHPSVQRLRTALGDIGMEKAYLRGVGCPHCAHRGVIGRTVVGEFLLPDSTFLKLMLKGETYKAIEHWISDLGGKTLKDNAITRMLNGTIDIEEVERWTGLLDEPPVY